MIENYDREERIAIRQDSHMSEARNCINRR